MPHDGTFETPESVMFALRRYRDVFDAKTSSIIVVSTDRFDPSRGPFGALVSQLDRREELRRRMIERIPDRERKLLFLWYVADLPPARIAAALEISRMHCYRLRKNALSALCDEEQEEAS